MNSFTASEAKVQFGELLSQAMREPVSIYQKRSPESSRDVLGRLQSD